MGLVSEHKAATSPNRPVQRLATASEHGDHLTTSLHSLIDKSLSTRKRIRCCERNVAQDKEMDRTACSTAAFVCSRSSSMIASDG